MNHLYKVFTAILFPLLTIFSLSAQTIVFNDSWEEAGFNLSQASTTKVEVVYSIEEFYMDEVNHENKKTTHDV